MEICKTCKIILLLILSTYGYAQDFNQEALTNLRNARMPSYGIGSINSYAHGVIKRADGMLWLTTADGVIRFDGKRFITMAEPNMKFTFFRKIFELDSVIYLGDIDKPLHYYDTSDSIPKISRVSWPENVSDELFIWSTYKHHDGRVFLTDHKGIIYNYNAPGDIDTFFVLPQDVLDSPEFKHTARYIRSDPFDNDKVWICSLHGMFHLDMTDTSYEYFPPKESEGLYIYNHSEGFTFYDHIQMGDNIWISTYANGLVRFNTKTKEYTAFRYESPYDKLEIGTNFMRSHIAYDDQNIIIGGRILKIFNTVTNQYYDFFRGHDDFDPAVSLSVNIHKSGDQYYIISSGGMESFLPENNLFQSGKLSKEQLEAEENSIIEVNETSNGNLIITTNKNKKFLWDYTRTVLRPVTSEDLKNETVSNDKAIKYQILSDTIYLQDENGKSNRSIFIEGITGITGVVKDLSNQLWIKSNEGLISYNSEENTYSIYHQHDGLWNYVWSDPGIIKTLHDGSIFASTGMTFTLFHPSELPSKQDESIKPYVYKLDVFNKTVSFSYDLKEEINQTLEPGDNYFTIHYSSLIENPSHDIEYRYQLNGFDDDWIFAGRNNAATYSKVPPGDFTFSLQARYPGHKWTAPHEQLRIDLKPSFTQSTIFHVLVTILIFSMLYALYKYRTYHLLKEQKIESEFQNQLAEVKLEALRSQMNPHFLFNCLNSIDNYILTNRSEEASMYLTKFAKLIRNILDYSKRKQITLGEELATFELYTEMEKLRFSNRFEYSVQVDKKIDLTKELIPPLMLQPYVENAIWHGLLHKEEKGQLTVCINKVDNKLEISVDDNGIGRVKALSLKSKSATKRKSHGMKITEARIRILNELHNIGGEVEIIDKYDQEGIATGTKVLISLPCLES